jgi:hypothetical protein
VLTRVFPVLQRVPAARRPLLPGAAPVAADELQRRAARSLAELLGAIAALRPVVIAIDDGDQGTAAGASLMTAFDGDDGPRCLLVLGHGDDPAGLVRTTVASWRGDLRRIELA